MSSATRGEIWQVNLDPTRGTEMQKRRPAVVISSPTFNRQALRIIVPITTWQPKFATWSFMVFLQATPTNGLTNDSGGNTLQVRCVSTERLIRKVGVLSASDLEDVVAAVALSIGYK